MQDYELAAVTELIAKFRRVAQSEPSGAIRLLRLNALFVYFQYAVASVRLQEDNIRAMAGGQHKDFATHDAYEDCLLKLYTSAVTAYSNLRTCLNFSRALQEGIPEETFSGRLKAYRERHAVWAKELIDRRDRITAHPEKQDALVWKPNMWSDDGRVRFAVRNLDDFDLSRQVTLHPRDDLELLRSYLSGLAPLLGASWGLR